jgi:hypothetical protein
VEILEEFFLVYSNVKEWGEDKRRSRRGSKKIRK